MTSTEGLGVVARELMSKIEQRDLTVAVMGLGYVGLPLAVAFAEADVRVLGFDIDPPKIETLLAGNSYLKTVSKSSVNEVVESGALVPTGQIADMHEADAILICVPTPLSRHREPDLSYVDATIRSLRPHLRRGQVLVLSLIHI